MTVNGTRWEPTKTLESIPVVKAPWTPVYRDEEDSSHIRYALQSSPANGMCIYSSRSSKNLH